MPRGILALLGLLCAPVTIQAAPQLFSAHGYAQLTLEPIYSDMENGLQFGAERVRLGGAYTQGRWFAAAELDVNRDSTARAPGSLSNLITDLYAGYELSQLLRVQWGQFKVPVGMDFLVPGDSLDIVRRGMDASLALGRTIGLMAHGNVNGQAGYNFGVFNLAGRSVATTHTEEQVGDINVLAARLFLAPSQALHLEGSLGYSPLAGGASDSHNYILANTGLRLSTGTLTGKFEYSLGMNVRGDDNHNQQVVQLHLGYQSADWIEWVGRVYLGGSETEAGNTTLQNTFMGVNIFMDPRRPQHRLQVQYILTTGDTEAWSGVGGILSDTLFIQFQAGFDV